MTFYNEIDPFAAAWLKGLADAGEISGGVFDERPIQKIKAAELVGVRRAHFFAGIGGWELALRLAGWPEDEEIWTGSAPCQPFSAAGRRRGIVDERHLWPAFRRLIAERRPSVVIGEQVASKDGRAWLGVVRSDLEALGYRVGAADLCSAGVGADHIRQRLYWVADTLHTGRPERRPSAGDGSLAGSGGAGGLGDADGLRRAAGPNEPRRDSTENGTEMDFKRELECTPLSWLAHTEHAERGPFNVSRQDGRDGQDAGRQEAHGESGTCGQIRGLAQPDERGRRGRRNGDSAGHCGEVQAEGRGGAGRMAHAPHQDGRPGERQAQAGTRPDGERRIGLRSDCVAILCTDGKSRRVGAGVFPLAHGLSRSLGQMLAEHRGLAELAGLDGRSLTLAKKNRIGRLKGYGNAIDPELAAEFVKAYMDAKETVK